MSLEQSIIDILETTAPLAPLPTTRVLGQRVDISHVTVSRMLRKMADDGLLWQAESGRYYRVEAEAKLARPRPIGCLVRSLSSWAAWYEGIMAGVGRACEKEGRSILVYPVADFIRQKGAGEPSRVLSNERQKTVLGRYLDRHRNHTERLLLDDSWSDVVLEAESDRLGMARMLLRPTLIKGLEACYPDYSQGARLGLSHLLEQSYRKIIFVQPYIDNPITHHIESAVVQAFSTLKADHVEFELRHSDGASGFPQLLQELKRQRKNKIALICPEDNFAVVLLRQLEQEGLELPDKVGLLGAMGTEILKGAGISRLCVDFKALGERAVTGPIRRDGGPSINFTLEADMTTGNILSPAARQT